MKILNLLFALLFLGISFVYSQSENKNMMDGSIDSFEDLIWLSDNPDVWNENWVLTTDIDATETAGMNGGLGFSPLGDSPSEFGVRQQISFTGTFDGQGHVISNITINRPNEPYVGFFGHIESGNVQNLGLENMTVNGYRYVGGFVGYLTLGGNIANCYTNGSFEATEYTGGFVGITYSNNTISHCHSKGSVQTDKWGGGFVGDNYAYTTISNSYSGCSVSGVDYLGGFAGNNRWFSNIYSSYATGNVVGSGWYIGGFVGDNSESYIQNSFSSGDVNGEYGVGGFAGHNYWLENNDMGIETSYATGQVDGNVYTGAFSGFNEGFVNDCYFDIELAGNVETCGTGCGPGQVTITGLATADFAFESNFINWDFENTWTITTISNISPFKRPYLGTDFEVYELNLIASPDEGGVVNGSGSYLAGEVISISAEANPVWAFENWTDEDGNILSEDAVTSITMPDATTTIYANFKSTVGIENVSNQTLNIRPNPASDQVYLQNISSGVLKVMNIQGQIIIENQIDSQYVLNISDLNKGVYILSLESLNTNYKTTLIKK